MSKEVRELGDHPYRNGFLVTFGLTYWFTALLRPDIVANLDSIVSAAALLVMGALVLGNLLLDSDVLWALLAAFMTSGIVSSWAGVTRWAIPYSAEAAAMSMAAVNAAAAVVLFATALDR